MKSSITEVWERTSCLIASRRPSCRAPSAIFCSVCGRPPTGPNICGRASEIFTGRLAFSAAMAASTTCDQVEPLQPKPPPTKGDTTRTRSSAMPSVFATVSFTPEMYCVLSYSVRLFRSHAAMVACGSMGLCVSIGVV